MRYLLTVLKADENEAIDVLYLGRDYLKMRDAVNLAHSNVELRGKRICMLRSTDDGEVVERRVFPLY